MSDKELIHLVEKYLAGKCSPEESKKVEEWYEAYQIEGHQLPEGDSERIKNAAHRSLHAIQRKAFKADKHHKNNTVDFRKSYTYLRYIAASVVLLASIAYLFFNSDNANNVKMTQVPAKRVQDIPPGGNNAILTLANGKKVGLNKTKEGLIVGASTLNYNDGTSVLATQGNFNSDDAKANTMSIHTPSGGTYKILLADGTRVWLNAASTMNFPEFFSETERVVSLTGEAYFEVAPNKEKPFKVKIPNGAEVRVTGTHFNIMAYENESKVSTILLEGGVHMLSAGQDIALRPGQQAVLDKHDGTIKRLEADLEEAVAWKSGYFSFNEENIHSIMRKIARWYSVDVVYKGDMSGKDFSGTVSRHENVSEVLKMLELTGIIHFKVEGRRILVMP